MTESNAVRFGGSFATVKVPCPVSTGGTCRRLGSVKLTVVISALVSSFKLPRSGVEVQDAAGLPLLNHSDITILYYEHRTESHEQPLFFFLHA